MMDNRKQGDGGGPIPKRDYCEVRCFVDEEASTRRTAAILLYAAVRHVPSAFDDVHLSG